MKGIFTKIRKIKINNISRIIRRSFSKVFFPQFWQNSYIANSSAREGQIMQHYWYVMVRLCDIVAYLVLILRTSMMKAKLRLCHKLNFSCPYIFAAWWCKLLNLDYLILQNLCLAKSNVMVQRYKNQTSWCKDIRIIKLEFVASDRILYFPKC